LKDRKVLVRLHNVEYSYYKNLHASETGIFRRLYYFMESILLKKYEKRLAQMSTFLTVSKTDESLYKTVFNAQHLHFLPVFIPWSQIKSKAGSGNFCLYHGNLSVNENEKAVLWLLEEIFSKVNIPFVVAGKNPSSTLKKAAHQQLNTCLVENPSEHELDDLIRKAQVNILPSYNSTGVKLKLINALFNGRHCLVNKAAAEGTAIEEACFFAEDANEFNKEVTRLFDTPFTEDDICKRKQILGELYDNNKNAETLIKLLY
jgi:glycosyltransferase involved in cell wall biosynthesis